MRFEVFSAIRDAALTPSEQHFLAMLETRNNEDNDGYFGTRERIFKDMGISKSTLYQLRDELADKGVLEYTNRGYKEPTVYKVLLEGLKKIEGDCISRKPRGKPFPAEIESDKVSQTGKDIESVDGIVWEDDEEDVSQTGTKVSQTGKDVSLFADTKDNKKYNNKNNNEKEHINNNIKEEEDFSSSEKSGVLPSSTSLSSEGSVVPPSPSLVSNKEKEESSSLLTSALLSRKEQRNVANDEETKKEESPSSVLVEEPVRDEPIMEEDERENYKNWKTINWNKPALKIDEDDWTYYSKFLKANKDKLDYWQGWQSWSRGNAGWEVKISDYVFEQLQKAEKYNQNEVENMAWN